MDGFNQNAIEKETAQNPANNLEASMMFNGDHNGGSINLNHETMDGFNQHTIEKENAQPANNPVASMMFNGDSNGTFDYSNGMFDFSNGTFTGDVSEVVEQRRR